MATRKPRRPHAEVINADRQVLSAIVNLSDYMPANPAYTIEALRALDTNLAGAQSAELRLIHELYATRERVAQAAIALHAGIKGARAQVVAQFGDDSVALHAVGLKKVSEYKRPVRLPRPE
jgi:hypothetical protein